MQKNKNIDIVRAIAVLMVVIYHFYVVVGAPLKETFSIVHSMINLGGEIGVTLFFIISGFGIYNSIHNMTKNGEPFSFDVFIKKRLKRILPEYYFCLIILLLLTGSSIYLMNDNSSHLISHTFLFHNLFPDTHGSINGVLWTMGVIMQFYIVAYPLFCAVKKHPYLTYVLSVIMVVIAKVIFYRYVVAPNNLDNVYYFIYGRQLFSAIDNFILGMLIAKLILSVKKAKTFAPIFNYLLFLGSFAAFIFFIYISGKHQIYGTNNYSYLFHSALAFLLATNIFMFIKIKLNEKRVLFIFMDFISKYEYGIYLWHLFMMQCLLANSSLFVEMRTRDKFIVLMLLSIIFGYFTTKLIEKFDFDLYINYIKNNAKKIISVVIIIFLLFNIPTFYSSAKTSIMSLTDIVNGNIKTEDKLGELIKNVNDNIPSENKYTYLYIDDTSTEGYMNFYRMRYYLSPNSSIYYNTYADLINSGDETIIFKYLKEIDVDYFIIRKSSFLEEKLNIKIDSKGIIFKKNKNAVSKIEELFLEIEK
jgi:peptidoglycan/LPS O-acetylase OafA/YrhL